MKPIWYFVGLFLLTVGVIIFAAGVYYVFHPEEQGTVLASLHPSLWWGAVITISGLIFTLANKNKTV